MWEEERRGVGTVEDRGARTTKKLRFWERVRVQNIADSNVLLTGRGRGIACQTARFILMPHLAHYLNSQASVASVHSLLALVSDEQQRKSGRRTQHSIAIEIRKERL